MSSSEAEKKLECPFTWEMDDIDSTIDRDYKPHDEEELMFPLLKLVRIIMTVYVKTKEKEVCSVDILQNIKKCEEIRALLKKQESEEFCNAVKHVVQATKFHALTKLGKENDAKELLENIKDFNPDNKIERSTINGCRSSCWSQYHRLGKNQAFTFIRRALDDNPTYHLWHFILGKNLRRMRRDKYVGDLPCREEQEAFLKAYDSLPNVVYGLFVAQMYRESRQNSQAIKMYQEVLRKKPSSDTIYLRLALGFIQLFQLHEAGLCLDEVHERCCNDSIYSHYRGKYLMKKRRFREAADYLKKASVTGNIPALNDYICCMSKLNPSYDPLKYLLNLEDSFQDFPEENFLSLLIDIALCYLEQENLKKSMSYFLKIFEINPSSDLLQKHFFPWYSTRPISVYDELIYQVFPGVNRSRDSLDKLTLDLYDELKMYSDDHRKNKFEKTEKAFEKLFT